MWEKLLLQQAKQKLGQPMLLPWLPGVLQLGHSSWLLLLVGKQLQGGLEVEQETCQWTVDVGHQVHQAQHHQGVLAAAQGLLAIAHL